MPKAQPSTESRHIGVGGGVAQNNKDMPEESKLYLTEVERRDMEMEQIELTRVGDGVNQLKQIVVDMNERVKLQNAELEPIAEQLADHREDMGEVNKRLKAAARKGKRWGSFGRNLLCMLLLVGQVIALGYLVQFIIQENRKH